MSIPTPAQQTATQHGSLEYHLADLIALIKHHMPNANFAAVKQAEAALKAATPTLREAIKDYREARAAFEAKTPDAMRDTDCTYSADRAVMKALEDLVVYLSADGDLRLAELLNAARAALNAAQEPPHG